MHLEVSNNSSSIFRSCQKKYYFNYILGLKPIKKSSALSLGSIIHEAFDWFYKGQSHGDVLKFIETAMDNQISKTTPEDVEDLTVTKHTLLGMWIYYPWKFPNLDWDKVEPELEFRIQVPKTRGITLVGKIDGLVTDKQGKLWIRELKTTSQPFSQFEVRSRQSSQGSAYLWASRALGMATEGIMFDYIKKPLLRKGVNETMDGYGQRIQADFGNRPDVYYKRHPSYRTNTELSLFEDDLRQVAYDMRRRTRDGKWHRNQDQCYTYNTACPYLPICFQQVPDQNTVDAFYTREKSVNKGVKPIYHASECNCYDCRAGISTREKDNGN